MKTIVAAWSRLRLTVRMLLVFSTLSVVSLLIVGILAWTSIEELGDVAVVSSTSLGRRAAADGAEALEQQARESLLRLAQDQGAFSGAFFDRLSAEVEVAARYAATRWSADAIPSTERQVAALGYAPVDPMDGSSYHLAPGADLQLAAADLVRTRDLDDLFPALVARNPNLASIYFGAASGLMQAYPSQLLPAEFDPRARSWYQTADAADTVVWSEPYVDASGLGLVITASKAVRGPGGSLAGVIGADVIAGLVTERIVTTRLGQDGHAFLLDGRGDVIARPEISAGDARWTDTYESDNLLKSDNPAVRSLATDMVAGRVGLAVVAMSDGEHFVSYAPVPHTSWSIGLALPLEEVRAPVQASEQRMLTAIGETSGWIDRRTLAAQGGFAATFAIVLLVAGWASTLLSRTVTRPIQRLTDAARALERRELPTEQITALQEVKGEDEVAALTRVFATMAAEMRARETQLRRQVEELRIEIDQVKKAQQVAEITESDYFQDLRRQARALRGEIEEPAPPPSDPAALNS